MADITRPGHRLSPSFEAAAEIEVEAILEPDADEAKEPNLEQVREILFGAESRRAESARRELEGAVAERFGRLEAEYERRFELLLRQLEDRFARACEMLDAETRERRTALAEQHHELVTKLAHASTLLSQAKTSREELAELLTHVADRLRAAASLT
jgi:two-component sensor histidine kinase